MSLLLVFLCVMLRGLTGSALWNQVLGRVSEWPTFVRTQTLAHVCIGWTADKCFGIQYFLSGAQLPSQFAFTLLLPFPIYKATKSKSRAQTVARAASARRVLLMARLEAKAQRVFKDYLEMWVWQRVSHIFSVTVFNSL